MSLRPSVYVLARFFLAGLIVLAATVLPISLSLDLDTPVAAPPLATTLLLLGSNSLLAIVGCVLRGRRTAPGVSAKTLA